jgi:dTMP kinase
MFITFEGIEGCGKSTQIRRLTAHLEELGREVLVTMEPGGSRVGKELRRMLLSMESADLCGEAELFLYLADRAQHVSRVILPALEAGKVVLSDRFADSTVAYQGYGRGIDPKLLNTLNNVAVAGVWPGLTIVLDLEARVGLSRATARNEREGKTADEGRFEAESLAFHTRVREGYLTLAALYQDRVKVVDGSGTPDEVFARVLALVESALAEDADGLTEQ